MFAGTYRPIHGQLAVVARLIGIVGSADWWDRKYYAATAASSPPSPGSCMELLLHWMTVPSWSRGSWLAFMLRLLAEPTNRDYRGSDAVAADSPNESSCIQSDPTRVGRDLGRTIGSAVQLCEPWPRHHRFHTAPGVFTVVEDFRREPVIATLQKF